MSLPLDETRRFSLQLSKVLDDIGVNDDMVRKRRHIALIQEAIRKQSCQLQGMNATVYNFGSRTEGTTTIGLNADVDILFSDNRWNVIQELAEWREGYTNILMVQDAKTPPGYCLLHITCADFPLPIFHSTATRNLLRNDCFAKVMPKGAIRNGPSVSRQGIPGVTNDDFVYALFCKSWPKEARHWEDSVWPSNELKRKARYDGCLLVPVGRRGTENEKFQWRISTSLTERRLMFNLNIVQIRCYVLMKMILKTHQILDSDVALSTYICKTVLFHCIEKSEINIWRDDNLLECLNICLKYLRDCVVLSHCPHFIINANNLMENRISSDVKPVILAILEHILNSKGRALMDIDIDHLGMRLNRLYFQVPFSLQVKRGISRHLSYNFTLCLGSHIRDVLLPLTNSNTDIVVQKLTQYIEKLESFGLEGDDFEQKASELILPFIYTSLGSVMASESISKNVSIEHSAITMLEHGSSSDFSSLLKRATVFYGKGDMNYTFTLLDQIEKKYTIESLQSVCSCYQNQGGNTYKAEFIASSVDGDIKNVMTQTAFCVRYLPSEVNCVPDELKHEYFRLEVNACQDYKMYEKRAVVDSIPFFYFLQYKVCCNQGFREKQQTALHQLRRVIDCDRNLGHRETALNLLGQCMEQENRFQDALHCYNASINLRQDHNAATSLKSNLTDLTAGAER